MCGAGWAQNDKYKINIAKYENHFVFVTEKCALIEYITVLGVTHYKQANKSNKIKHQIENKENLNLLNSFYLYVKMCQFSND